MNREAAAITLSEIGSKNGLDALNQALEKNEDKMFRKSAGRLWMLL